MRALDAQVLGNFRAGRCARVRILRHHKARLLLLFERRRRNCQTREMTKNIKKYDGLRVSRLVRRHVRVTL